MGTGRTILVTVVLLAGVVAFLTTLDVRESQIVQRELAVGFALRVVGGMVSVVGLVGLLGQWYAGACAARLAAGGVVVLAGLAVASPSWASALGLAVVLASSLALPRGQAPDAEPDAAADGGCGKVS